MSRREKSRSKENRPIVPILPVAAAIFAFAAAILVLALQPRITVADKSPQVEAGGAFDPSALVESFYRARWEDVTVTGSVDTGVPGTYELVLSVENREQTVSVEVVDTTAPEFVGLDGHYTVKAGDPLTAEELVEEVRDVQPVTLELDLNGADLNVPGEYTVYLTAKDSSGNEGKEPIALTVEPADETPPVITGADNTAIYIGEEFDPMEDVTVTDNEDPNPTLRVDASDVDTSRQGRYTVRYTAVDEKGNETVTERVVMVSGRGKYIYTTAGGATWDATGRAPHPYLVAVNRAMCTVTVYGKDDNGNYTVPVKAMACSVGRDGHNTLRGEYRTSERIEWCYMVDGTWGRYAIRIYRGLMFHSVPYYSIDKGDMEWEEFNKLGEPASLGCVRLAIEDILWLYENCPYSFTAVIYDDTVEAGPLGKPETFIIDTTDEALLGWDPTDPDPQNPWNSVE